MPHDKPGHGWCGLRLCRDGPYSGGQAELLRVPYGDYNCLVLPRDAEEKETDYVMLADIFPTGYHATQLAGVGPGDSVVIYGAGPVGLMAALSSMLKGASQVMVVDTHKDRLQLAEKIGAIAIDDTEDAGVEQILELTGGAGADRGCECVGYQCCNMHREEVPNLTMNNLVQTVKATGRIGVVGVFVPEDPKAEDKLEKRGRMAFDSGQFWFKGQSIGTGHRPCIRGAGATGDAGGGCLATQRTRPTREVAAAAAVGTIEPWQVKSSLSRTRCSSCWTRPAPCCLAFRRCSASR